MSVGSIQGALAQGALTDSRKAFSLKPERALTEQYKQEAKSELFLLRQSLLKCIEAIKASMTAEEFRGYLKGNAMKYLWRYQDKGNPAQDIAKANWYLNRLKEELG